MSESFWILITPPKGQFRQTLATVLESFLGLDWKLEKFLYPRGKRHVDELQTPTKEDLLRPGAGNAILSKDSRGLDLDFDFQFPGRITIGGDATFFHGASPLAEMKALFGRMRLPAGCKVKGDLEGVLDRRGPSWFSWIAQIERSKWDELVSKMPEAANRELTQIGETHVAMLADSPYGRGDELFKLIRLMGKPRVWPRHSRKM